MSRTKHYFFISVAIVSILVAFTFLHHFIHDFPPAVADSVENVDEDVADNGTGNGDANVINNVENNINGEQAEVHNSIENNIQSASDSSVDNNVMNQIDVRLDVHVSNDVINQIDGQKQPEESHGDKGNGRENGTEKGNGDENGTGGNGEDGSANGEGGSEIIWGVDTASLTDEDFHACVSENFGNPEVWGRYLGDKEGVSYGLTEDEIELIHGNDAQILVIWNHFTEAVGYDKGQSEANDAIEMARELGVPEGVALFANVEPIYPIDADFITGWYDALNESQYEAGIYGVFDPDQEISTAFEEAAANHEDILDDMYVWTSAPEIGVSTEENAPDEYEPLAPEGSLAYGWQYGIEADTCNIDTNLFTSNMLDVLW